MSTRADATMSHTASGTVMSYREAIRAAMEDEMAHDPRVVLMGEDVGPAGGVFKTSEGLADKFGLDRVRDTPICENTFVGVAIGMAVTGMRPIVEIMFSDFLPTAGDAIVNELPKFRFMTGGQCSVPVTVRTIGGATGRFGTQHSATGESWFMQMPGLRIAAAASPSTAYGLLRAAIRDDNPVLFYEHKGLYNRKGPVVRDESGIAEVGKAAVVRSGSDLTVVATLLMADRAFDAANKLEDRGISVEVIDPCWLRPFDIETVQQSVAKTGRLLLVEEQVHAAGWGATLISKLAMRGLHWRVPPRALSLSDDVLIPYSPPLEDQIVPTVEAITEAIIQMATAR